MLQKATQRLVLAASTSQPGMSRADCQVSKSTALVAQYIITAFHEDSTRFGVAAAHLQTHTCDAKSRAIYSQQKHRRTKPASASFASWWLTGLPSAWHSRGLVSAGSQHYEPSLAAAKGEEAVHTASCFSHSRIATKAAPPARQQAVVSAPHRLQMVV